MKVLKWLAIGLFSFVLVIFAGGAALVYLVDWNDFRETIQKQVKKQTGRDLTIAGDLKPTVFPFIGVSLGEISFDNASGFGDLPFAKMGGADVKVKLLPLLKKEVNVKTIELHGLDLDLQRAADGTTNWDDLIKASEEGETEEVTTAETEEEDGGNPIAALDVGGIIITDSNVSWRDVQAGTDVKLSNFNLTTGAIALAEPFDFDTNFKLASNSMALAADVDGNGQITADLDNEIYTLNKITLVTNAVGESLPGGRVETKLAANIVANLAAQTVNISPVTLDVLGISLEGLIDVRNLDTEPAVTGKLSSNEFAPLELFQKLGIEAPVTADPSVLAKASLSLALDATPNSASLNDLTIKLDDTTFSGNASVPSLASEVPPLRFKFAVDAIDLDRYLPPEDETASGDEGNAVASTTTGDEPIELPLEMMRQLDVDGRFDVGNVKIKNLTTTDIAVPVVAKNGIVSLPGITANMYQGRLNSTFNIDATSDTPAYAADFKLDGIQADPLLTDLLEETSFLSGTGLFAANITMRGNTVNSLTSALNGNFNTSFSDGFIRGVNLGYQIRRARAAITRQSLSVDEEQVKTDFTALGVGGQITNGVVQSDDLDMRSPLLRVNGAGLIDLPAEQVDYTLTTLITGSSEGQGGDDLAALKGVKLSIPIRGSFDELSADFSGVILAAMKQNIADNIKGQAKAEADRLKAEAQAKIDAEKARAEARLAAEEEKARARLAAEEDKARARLAAEQARAQEKLNEQQSILQSQAAEAVKKNKDKAKNKLKSLFK